MGPRKELFFEIVESGLQSKFSKADIARVYELCDFTKRMEQPAPLGPMHEPCEEYIRDLTANPWWDSDTFSWVRALEEQSPVIAKELDRVLGERDFVGDSAYQANVMGGGWSAFRLQRLGEWNDKNTAIFAETTKIVQALGIPFAVRGVMFAKQTAGSGVQPHSDGRNFILTAHLGLRVPKQEGSECWIEVAGERREWEEGKVIVFDTSFSHCTDNTTDDDRYVLIIDFWHPDLSAPERDALDFLYDCRNKFESGNAKNIDAPYVNEGRSLTVDGYVKSKDSFGNKFASFFTNGGLVKF